MSWPAWKRCSRRSGNIVFVLGPAVREQVDAPEGVDVACVRVNRVEVEPLLPDVVDELSSRKADRQITVVRRLAGIRRIGGRQTVAEPGIHVSRQGSGESLWPRGVDETRQPRHVGDFEVAVGTSHGGGSENIRVSPSHMKRTDSPTGDTGHHAVTRFGYGSVGGVHETDDIISNVLVVVAVDAGVDPLAASPFIPAVRHDEDHLAAFPTPHEIVRRVQERLPLRTSCGGEICSVTPRGAAEAVQEIGHRIVALLRPQVRPRQKDGQIPFGGITEFVVFEVAAVDDADLKTLRFFLGRHHQSKAAVKPRPKPNRWVPRGSL